MKNQLFVISTLLVCLLALTQGSQVKTFLGRSMHQMNSERFDIGPQIYSEKHQEGMKELPLKTEILDAEKNPQTKEIIEEILPIVEEAIVQKEPGMSALLSDASSTDAKIEENLNTTIEAPVVIEEILSTPTMP